jgi:hypothetical protein
VLEVLNLPIIHSIGWGHKVTLKELQVFRVLQVSKETQDRKGQQEVLEIMDHRDQGVFKVHKDLRGLQVQ